MSEVELIVTTRCCLPHKRAREAGEVYLLPDGTETAAEGGEKVWDGERVVQGAWDGALLCTGHLARLRQIVARTPAMVVWLREHVVPGSVALDPDAPKQAPGKRSPAPLRLEAVDAADEEVACLASWVQLVAEERGEECPDLADWWVVPASVQVDNVRRVTVPGPGRVVGMRSHPRGTTTAQRAVVAAMKPPSRREGPRCILSDLLVSECACQAHFETMETTQ